MSPLFSHPMWPGKGRMPELAGATAWLGSTPLTRAELDGNVVLVQFGTFTCINWLRTLPHVRAWADTYGGHGLRVVGVQTPEFEIEHDVDSVRRAVHELHLEYPIAIDNDYAIWDAFANQFWPTLYLADAEGRIRHEHFGEGGYEETERAIEMLLRDAGAHDLPESPTPVDARGIELPADWRSVRSPETYIGLARSSGFASPGRSQVDEARDYAVPDRLALNEWALGGNWTRGAEVAVCNDVGGRIAFRFHARDLHLILAPPTVASDVRFRVRLDGQPPQSARGCDVDEDGNGVVSHVRLHQLIRQEHVLDDRHFEIEFLDQGVAALCFTFG